MKLAASDVEARVRSMHGWSVTSDALVRQYAFPSFPDAMTFAVRLGFDAQGRDHHPDLLISFKKVTVTWSTHSDGGITEKDFVGAGESDKIAVKLAGA
jgi:4a-hydroxytetrahydrobiopterin dehydratase